MKRNITLIFLLSISYAAYATMPINTKKLLEDGMKAVKMHDFEQAERIIDQLKSARARNRAMELEKEIDKELRKGLTQIARNLPEQTAKLKQERRKMNTQKRDLTAQAHVKTTDEQHSHISR